MRCSIVFQGHPSNFKVPQDKKSLILIWIWHFRTVTPAWIYWWLWNTAQSLMEPRRGALLFFEVIHLISRSYRMKNQWFESNLSKVTRPVAAIKSLRFALFTKPYQTMLMILQDVWSVWYKTKIGSQSLATNFGVFFMIQWRPFIARFIIANIL